MPADLYFLGIQIHLYSWFFAGGLLAAYLVARWAAKKNSLDEDVFDTAVLAAIVFGFTGARLFFVLGHWANFSAQPSEILKFWQGGLAWYGGLIGGALGLYLIWLFAFAGRRTGFLKLLDALALGLPLGQAIGRFGNLFNYEAYGAPTSLHWKMFVPQEFRLSGYESFAYFHPTFFYESLGLLLLFLFLLKKHTDFSPGTTFAVYALASGILRFLIEFLRLDALVVSGLKISQVIAIVMVATGGVLLVTIRSHSQIRSHS